MKNDIYFKIYDRLKNCRVISRCKSDRFFTKKILKDLKVSKKDTYNFFRFCDRNGGVCDCEIYCNALEAKIVRMLKQNKKA